jgi:hypothetical protein
MNEPTRFGVTDRPLKPCSDFQYVFSTVYSAGFDDKSRRIYSYS